jgi:hypothetical protein
MAAQLTETTFDRLDEAPRVARNGAKIVRYGRAAEMLDLGEILRVPFGLSQYNGQGRHNLDFEVPTASLPLLHGALTALDKHVLEEGLRNSVAWFGKQHTRDEIQGMFTPCLRHKDEKYNPTLRTKVNIDSVEIVDEQGAPMPANSLEKNTHCEAVVYFTSVWIAARSFGPTLVSAYLRVRDANKPVNPFKKCPPTTAPGSGTSP